MRSPTSLPKAAVASSSITSGRIAEASMTLVMSSANSSGVAVASATWKSRPARSGNETSASTSQIRRLPASWRTVSTKTALI